MCMFQPGPLHPTLGRTHISTLATFQRLETPLHASKQGELAHDISCELQWRSQAHAQL